jgi:DNA repair exonuclease SbcCD nuclease subunit
VKTRFRVLQVGDLHVGRGRSSWGEKVSLERAALMLDVIFRTAKAEKVHAVLITGDVFDTKAVTNKEREVVARKLTQYAGRQGIPTYVIPGNHDLVTKTASNLDFLAEITEQTAEIPNLHVAFASKESIWSSPVEGLSIIGVPVTMSEDQRWIESFCENLTSEGRFIFMGHGTIRGCVRNDANWRPSEAEDVQRLSLNLAAQTASQVIWWAYGDIHKRQKLPTLPGDAKGWYAGSPVQMDFGETPNRGGLVVAFDQTETGWVFKGQRYVRMDDQGFAPLITVLNEEDIDDLPPDALIRLGAGLVLPESRHKQIVSTLKVVEDRSTPEAAVIAAGTTEDGEAKPLEGFDPLLADLSVVEDTVLEGLPNANEPVLLAEARRVVEQAVERFRARTYVS